MMEEFLHLPEPFLLPPFMWENYFFISRLITCYSSARHTLAHCAGTNVEHEMNEGGE